MASRDGSGTGVAAAAAVVDTTGAGDLAAGFLSTVSPRVRSRHLHGSAVFWRRRSSATSARARSRSAPISCVRPASHGLIGGGDVGGDVNDCARRVWQRRARHRRAPDTDVARARIAVLDEGTAEAGNDKAIRTINAPK